jgi:hypothetical protein
MLRPPCAREALRRSPSVQAGWAHSPCIEGVPRMTAVAEPFVFFAGRPAAERAADARTRWLPALLFLNLAIQNN